MKQTANLMLRVPVEIHQWLSSFAEKNHRSMNNQAVVIIREFMKQQSETVTPQPPSKASAA